MDAGRAELQFGRIVGVDSDPSSRIYVLDGQSRRVSVFAPDGSLVTSFGRGGGGPDEFSQMLGQQMPGLLFVMADGSVAIPDMGNARVAHFGPDGEVLDSHPITLDEGIPMRWSRSADRSIYRQVRRMGLPGVPAQGPLPRTR